MTFLLGRWAAPDWVDMHSESPCTFLSCVNEHFWEFRQNKLPFTTIHRLHNWIIHCTRNDSQLCYVLYGCTATTRNTLCLYLTSNHFDICLYFQSLAFVLLLTQSCVIWGSDTSLLSFSTQLKSNTAPLLGSLVGRFWSKIPQESVTWVLNAVVDLQKTAGAYH